MLSTPIETRQAHENWQDLVQELIKSWLMWTNSMVHPSEEYGIDPWGICLWVKIVSKFRLCISTNLFIEHDMWDLSVSCTFIRKKENHSWNMFPIIKELSLNRKILVHNVYYAFWKSTNLDIRNSWCKNAFSDASLQMHKWRGSTVDWIRIAM